MSDDDQGGPEEPTRLNWPRSSPPGSIVRVQRNATQTEASSDADGSTENAEAPDAEVSIWHRTAQATIRPWRNAATHAALNDMFTKVFGTPFPQTRWMERSSSTKTTSVSMHRRCRRIAQLAHAMDTAAEKKGKQKKSAPSSPASRRGTPVKFRVDLGSLINRLFTPKD